MDPQIKYHPGLLVAILVTLIFSSCSTVKYVPDNHFLLSRSLISIDDPAIDETELRSYLKQRPNAKILGFWHFHLGLYNLSSKKNENGMFKRIGEAPVILNPLLTEKSKEEFQRYMRNKGYYQTVVTDTTIYKKNKKATVHYFIEANKPHRISSYATDIQDHEMRIAGDKDSAKSLIKVNQRFDTDVLSEESKRLIRNYQNQGYYKLNKNEIYFEADTTKVPRNVNLKMVIEKQSLSDTVPDIKKDHQKYTIRNFYFFTDFEGGKAHYGAKRGERESPVDTVKIGNQYFISHGTMRYNPELLMNMNHIRDRKFYSVDLVERTYNDLFSLRLFKLINIRFIETSLNDSVGNPTLDCIIQLTPSVRQSYSVSVEGTNSLGNLGVAGNLGYQHKNIFRSGELLDVTLRGATEKQSYGVGDSSTIFHSIETGVETKLTLPKFLAPVRTKNFFRYSTPQTLITLSYNYQSRPDYTRTIFSAGMGYQWKSSEFVTQRFNPIDLNMVKMFSYDSAFVARIENLYIKSSYTDHSISAWNYSITYNSQNIQKRSDYIYAYGSLETAGNILYGTSKLLDRWKHSDDDLNGKKYYFLGTPFAQYVKADLEFRKGVMIDKYNFFAFRAFGGIAVPYGNSDQIPFERKYYTGGANGIRAWAVRTLGPGSYKMGDNEFPNQSGDIKLEANAEYRFAMIGPFEGAFFVDMGNIWSLNDNREGTEFSPSGFYKEIAIGSGLGLRYDFSFAIIRVDMGIKLRDPSLDSGSRWIGPRHYLKSENINFAFAVGYPF